MSSLIHLIYASAATGDPTTGELGAIHAPSRLRNELAVLVPRVIGLTSEQQTAFELLKPTVFHAESTAGGALWVSPS